MLYCRPNAFMELLIHIGYLVAGLALLYYGAEWLVDGSTSLALKLGLSPLVIGLTVVAFGTSAPELFAGTQLNLGGYPDMAVGNVVGSNIFNILLILGFSAVMKPIIVRSQMIVREVPILIAISIMVIFMLRDGHLSYLDGVILTTGIVIYVVASLWLAKKVKNPEVLAEFESDVEDADPQAPTGKVAMLILGGLVTLAVGAKLLEMGGVFIAGAMGVSEAVIGLTVIAFGTSVPELATSIIAVKKNQGDIVAGNAIGSCIFNILAVLGITTLVKPMDISQIEPVDLGFMLGAAILILPLMITRRKIGRTEGALLLVINAVYIYILATR
jgi:cation:H+ antiporter